MSIKKRKEKITLVINDPNVDVFLTITIGNAQIGASLVQWIGNPTILKKGKISNLNLGKGADIINNANLLKITTNILDVNPATNGIAVMYYFHNTNQPTATFNDFVANDGDIFSFELEVDFKN